MNWARRLRWQAAVPVLVAMTAAASAAGAAQAAGPSGSGTGPGVPVVKGILGLPAGAAAAQAAPVLPLAGATPAVAATGDPTTPFVFAYTGSDKHAYAAPLSSPASEESLGGTLVGGPGMAFVPAPLGPGTALFARGTNNRLYAFTGTSWQSLGGGLTSRPGVAAGALSVPGGEAIDVVARGYDSSSVPESAGAAWINEIPTGFGWMYLGGPGRVLAGSGPAAVNAGGTLYVLVLATDGSVWVRHSTDPSTNWSAWKSLGGRASGDMGVASPAPGVGVAFVRGPHNAVYYNEFAGTTAGVTPGWHSLFGSLTSGVSAASTPDGSTSVLVVGPNGHIYRRTGTWPALTLGNWIKLF